jgi:hypothetical protein
MDLIRDRLGLDNQPASNFCAFWQLLLFPAGGALS